MLSFQSHRLYDVVRRCQQLVKGFLCLTVQDISSDRQNNEHIRENRTKNRTNIRQNRILQNNPNIFFFILLELYWIIRLNISVLIFQNNQTELLSWCLWVCFKSVKCYPQKQLGTLISMFTEYYILHSDHLRRLPSKCMWWCQYGYNHFWISCCTHAI